MAPDTTTKPIESKAQKYQQTDGIEKTCMGYPNATNTNPECKTNVGSQASERNPKARKNNNNLECETNVCPHLQAREKPIPNGKQTYALRQQIENES